MVVLVKTKYQGINMLVERLVCFGFKITCLQIVLPTERISLLCRLLLCQSGVPNLRCNYYIYRGCVPRLLCGQITDHNEAAMLLVGGPVTLNMLLTAL